MITSTLGILLPNEKRDNKALENSFLPKHDKRLHFSKEKILPLRKNKGYRKNPQLGQSHAAPSFWAIKDQPMKSQADGTQRKKSQERISKKDLADASAKS